MTDHTETVYLTATVAGSNKIVRIQSLYGDVECLSLRQLWGRQKDGAQTIVSFCVTGSSLDNLYRETRVLESTTELINAFRQSNQFPPYTYFAPQETVRQLWQACKREYSRPFKVAMATATISIISEARDCLFSLANHRENQALITGSLAVASIGLGAYGLRLFTEIVSIKNQPRL